LLIPRLGPDAYADASRYPEGPWCKSGDYVLFGRYAGARIVMAGEDNDDLPLRLLNDDEVLAVIDNPEDYVRVT
jgi:co-chaperonin GroES (HSP10)